MTIVESTSDPSKGRAGKQGHEYKADVVCVEGVAGFEDLLGVGGLYGVKIDT